MFKSKYFAVVFILSLSLSFFANAVMAFASSQTTNLASIQGSTPIQGADVTITGSNGSGYATSDALGLYNVTRFLDTGDYSVLASAPGYVDGKVENVPVTAGSETIDIDVFLTVSGIISGRVTGAPSGLPLAGVWVTAYNASGISLSGSSNLTDAEGNYQIDTNLPSGTYNVTAYYAPGYLDGVISGVSVQTGATTDNVDFELTLSGVISGTVTDSVSSLPLENVFIVAVSSDPSFGDYAITNSSGQYTLNMNLATGSYNVTAAFPAEHVPKTVADVAVTAGSQVTVDIPLDPSGRISGRVTSLLTGLGLSGATVLAEGDEYFDSATTNATGYYNITSGLGSGTYEVFVTYYSSFDYISGIAVVQGLETADVNFAIYIPASGTITGTVTNSTGAPIEFASVIAEGEFGSSSTETDENGNYTIDYGLETGSYNVTVSVDEYTSQTLTGVSVEVGSVTSNVDFILEAKVSGRISGHVLVAEPKANDVDFLVVRGTDNVVYYRIYNITTSSWTDWTGLPGSTNDSPAAALLNENLYIVVRGADGNTLWYGSVNTTDSTFSGWTFLDGYSAYAPTLTSNGTTLCLAVAGGDNSIYYRTFDGSSWSPWSSLPSGSTVDSPAAVLIGDELHVVVRGMDEETLWYSNLTSSGFSGWETLAGASQSKPVLTGSQSTGQICLVVRGIINPWPGAIYYNILTTTGGWMALPNGATGEAPGATLIGDSLQIVVKGVSDTTLWYGNVSLTSTSFSDWTGIDGSTPSAPTLTG